MTDILYVDNDNLVVLDGLKNAATDAYINNATVNLTAIRNSAGTTVSGETFPKSMTYVSASNGKYQASVDKAMVIVPGQNYTAVIDVGSSGIDGHWELLLICRTRNG
jgi:hypothetical protein